MDQKTPSGGGKTKTATQSEFKIGQKLLVFTGFGSGYEMGVVEGFDRQTGYPIIKIGDFVPIWCDPKDLHVPEKTKR
jgi:hypothetical protein